MRMDEIVYFDRYAKKACVEQVYGDRALRWIYGSLSGRLFLEVLVKRAIFSRWYGRRMDRMASRNRITAFIQQYGLDPSEFLHDVNAFASFNEFFARELKPNARPIDTNPASVIFPADGRHLCIPDISRADGLFVKGAMFDLTELLQDRSLADRFARGSLLLSRLCPIDYHRFHFPVAGTPSSARLVNGPLYSVNPMALIQNIRILAMNKRCVTELQSTPLGTVLLVEVGATCVGSICQTYAPGTSVTKGIEKGYFRFGGSSTITIFEPGRIRFDEDLLEHSRQRRELYARMGDRAGVAI